MKRIISVIVLAAGLVLLPLAVPSTGLLGKTRLAEAASAPTLAGEVFQSSAFNVTGGTGCQPYANGNSTFNFTATGTATGPLKGTYSETGTITIGDNQTGGPVNTLAVSGSFTITGSNGSTAATASVTTTPGAPGPGLDPNPPTGSNPFGYCSFPQPNVDAFVDFTATVGNTTLSTEAELTVTPVNGSPTQETFQQNFQTSTTISCFSSIDMPFNGTAIPAGTTLWMPAVIQLPGFNSSSPVTIYFTGQTVTYTVPGATSPTTVTVPNGSVTFSPSATMATTSYDPVAGWSTTVPSSVSGKSFFAGVAIPVTSSLPGSISPVTWAGQISSSTHGVSVHWQWGGAVYTTSFPTDLNQVNVKPVDDPQSSSYQNSDNAGTPENFKAYVTGGARGGGGSNYTGGWSATGKCTT